MVYLHAKVDSVFDFSAFDNLDCDRASFSIEFELPNDFRIIHDVIVNYDSSDDDNDNSLFMQPPNGTTLVRENNLC